MVQTALHELCPSHAGSVCVLCVVHASLWPRPAPPLQYEVQPSSGPRSRGEEVEPAGSSDTRRFWYRSSLVPGQPAHRRRVQQRREAATEERRRCACVALTWGGVVHTVSCALCSVQTGVLTGTEGKTLIC